MTVPRLVSAGASHRGLVREANEDAFLDRPAAGLWAVADGMGGHALGERAAAAVIEELAALPRPVDAPAHLRSVERALERAQARIATLDGSGGPVGCTVAVLLAFAGHFAVAWAGDSRVYRLRDGRLERLTRDHSAVQELIEQGLLDEDGARHHPWRSRLTRAVVSETPPVLDRVQGELRRGDRFLLCTDGLTAHLDDAALARAMAEAPPAAVVDRLVRSTLAAGASDNLTAVVVDVEPNRFTP